MKIIKFFVIGETGIGKSTLIDSYMWKLHFGYAYHDHIIDARRYHIQLVEISQLEEFENVLNQKDYNIPIILLCFKVNDRKSFNAVRRKWLTEIRKTDKNINIFLTALQCDRRKHLKEKIMQNYIKRSEGLKFCRLRANLHYLECTSLDIKSIEEAFDTALQNILYNEKEAEKHIVSLYNRIRNKFQVNYKQSVVMECK